MVKIHYVAVSLFSRMDGIEQGKTLLLGLLPKDTLLAEKLLEPEVEGGVFTEPLYELSAKIFGGSGLKFLEGLLSSLDDYDFNSILEKKSLYFDDDCNFYLRLSKKEVAAGNVVFDSKDSIHVKAKIAAYPAKKENALKVLDELLEKIKNERKAR